ncbi:acyl-CoA dehydrogenase [Niveispirillum sp.]|uniref:acyl-CoA dehydrogenase n=1 Tax=Niveispirillum sp. TaxID=1917217 RepID=UPI001B567BEF|nr:acyl-CoA dehydrogenase [Niveispirillum sp.]MBP7336137.1 acyl-CoA dehydrogenase [Niveispirillum sp.]
MSLVVHRRNLDFLLYETLGFGTVLSAPRFAGYDRAAVDAVLDTVQAIAENEFLPCAADLDAHEPHFTEGRVQVDARVRRALGACAEAGLFSAGFDHELGGLGMPATVTMLINGILAAANIGIANYQLLTVAGANMLASFGTDEQKLLFLRPMMEGRWFGTMCLSEPQAGSSLSDIRTRAEPLEGRLHRITGTKMWISGGDHDLTENIVHMVLARRPDGPPGVKGLSLFIVPKYRVGADGTPGEFNNIALAGLNHKMGQRGTTNCLLNFGEGGDCLGYLLGEPHQGLACMFHMMNEARIGVGANSAMSAQAGYLYSLDYARTRPQGRPLRNKDATTPQVPIIEHADVRRMLLAQKVAVEGALALSCYCTMLVDRMATATDETERRDLHLLLELLTPMAKSWPAEHCLEANKLAIQVLGGYGYTRDYPVERHYRDNRLNAIHEGAYGIHGLDLLGRKVRMEGGWAMDLLVLEIGQTQDAAEAQGGFGDEIDALHGALAGLGRATRAVLACKDPEHALANATLYLDGFGQIVIAWLWLKQAVAASRALESGTGAGETDFHQGKIAACRYFFRYELPRALPLLVLVERLDSTCLDVTPAQFLGD